MLNAEAQLPQLLVIRSSCRTLLFDEYLHEPSAGQFEQQAKPHEQLVHSAPSTLLDFSRAPQCSTKTVSRSEQ